MHLETVIGLEIHAQLRTRSKIFCSCENTFGHRPNSRTCPVCLGFPGALPVLNRQAVVMGVRAALALGCRINRHSVFARKNYFYPDLPKGYQISQYDQPLGEDGTLHVWTTSAKSDRDRGLEVFRILRVHLEEDAGKSIHRDDGASRVDLNRAGTPLVEIVSQPDLRSARQAADFMAHLRRDLIFLDVCDGNMQAGNLRCDANISLRPRGQEQLGVKTEIKNLNSFRFLQKALDYEIQRQTKILTDGRPLRQETRLWDEEKQRTRRMRGKEEASDYRYFPEPDLPPLNLEAVWIEEQRRRLPEMPEARRRRLAQESGFSDDESAQLVQSPAFADYFERMLAAGADARTAYNWMVGELTAQLNLEGRGIETCPLPAGHLARLIRRVASGELSSKMARTLFARIYPTGADPDRIIADEGLRQISDSDRLAALVADVVAAHPEKVVAYRGGKRGLLSFFVGQVMRVTQGQANPKLVNEMLTKKLDSES